MTSPGCDQSAGQSNDGRPLQHALVTGADGFLGTSLCRQLEQRGCRVSRWVGPRGNAAEGADFTHADLSRIGTWMDSFPAGVVVFHLAGRASVPASLTDPLESKAQNFDTTLNVLEAARRAGASVLLASTGAVYADSGSNVWEEADLTAPRSPYAAAKLAGENFAAAYACSYNMQIWTARLFSVYGPGMRGMAMRDFVARLIADPARLMIRGNGEQVRDYIHVQDAAAALIHIAERAPAGIYNVGSGEGVSVLQLARMLATACGHPDCAVEPDGANLPGEPHIMRANISRLTALGFQSKIDFEQGLAETVGWLQQTIKESRRNES